MQRDILVIDDEPETAAPLIEFLQSEGYTVRFAASGLDGIAQMEARKPGFVICDLEMPGLDGYQVMEASATRLGMSDLPFMLANAEWIPGVNWSLNAGGRTPDAHTLKPYVLQDIGRFVRRVLLPVDADP